MGEIKCAFMDRKKYNDYYCNVVDHNVPYEIYDKYCTTYYYDDCPNYKKCYVATTVCNELGLQRTRNVLKTLEYLRYQILENNEKYKKLLCEYDNVGPILFEKITKDKDKKQIVTNLYNLCIEKVSKLIELKKENEAIELYKEMINLLVQGYSITDSEGKLKVLA